MKTYGPWNLVLHSKTVACCPELSTFPEMCLCLYSDQISRSVVSDSLRPDESQHTRPPCPSKLPEFTQTHVHQVSDAIQPSHPLSSPYPPHDGFSLLLVFIRGESESDSKINRFSP